MTTTVLIIVLALLAVGGGFAYYWKRRIQRTAEAAHQRRVVQYENMHARREFAEIDYAINELEQQIELLQGDDSEGARDGTRRRELLLRMLRETRNRLEVKPLALDRLVADSIGRHRSALNGREIRFSHEDVAAPCEILGHDEALSWAIEELVVNTMSHAGSWSRIDVRLQAIPGGHELVVSDDGQGPDRLTRSRLFAPFTPRKESHGPGLGLYAVRRIVELHDGTIQAGPGPHGGLAHTLRLPEAGHSFIAKRDPRSSRLTG